MVGKKIGVLIALLSLALILSFISAGTLDIKKDVVSSMAIPELNLPAIYSVLITNTNGTDIFRIYSLVGVDLEPSDNITISGGETRAITLKAYPRFPTQISPNYYSFEYKIKGVYTPIQTDKIAMTIVKLKDAFGLEFEDINPDSETAILNFKNLGGHQFDKINLALSSEFFTSSQEFPLAPAETKKIEITLDRAKMKTLFAGPYVVDAKITVAGVGASSNPILTFSEKPGIKTTETKKGRMLIRYDIEKKNEGNVKTDVTIIITRNLFSGLFTSFNIDPDRTETKRFHTDYVFSRELAPGDSLRVSVTTNWWIFLGVLLVIIIILYIIDEYIRNKVVLTKRVSIVRTKGGEFALRVNIVVRARDFVEKIRVLDRLPPMVKVFEKNGLSSSPYKVDERNRRLEWDIQALSAGEERILTYIIYSKIGVVGRYELPSTEAIYEYKGRIKEASSNRAFLLNETKKEVQNNRF